MNNPDTNIFKIDRENDTEDFSRYHEKGISSINTIKKNNISSRLGRDKIVAANYKLSNTPKQFINHHELKPNDHNFPKLDNLIIDNPQYRRYFSYPYYYDYDYNYDLNQNTINYNSSSDYNIPAERYYKGEIRTKYGGEKNENEILEADEFDDNSIENFNTYNKHNKRNKHNKQDIFSIFIILCIVVVIIFLLKSK